jgi:hypothetical protein
LSNRSEHVADRPIGIPQAPCQVHIDIAFPGIVRSMPAGIRVDSGRRRSHIVVVLDYLLV